MVLEIPERIQRILEVGLGVLFAIVGLGDLWPAASVLPGFAPPGSSRILQVVTGSAAALGAAALFSPRSSRYGAWLLVTLWFLRTVWDMTGGETITLGWVGMLFLVLLVRGRREPTNEDRSTVPPRTPSV